MKGIQHQMYYIFVFTANITYASSYSSTHTQSQKLPQIVVVHPCLPCPPQSFQRPWNYQILLRIVQQYHVRISVGIVECIDIWTLEPIAHGGKEVDYEIFPKEESVTNVRGSVGGGTFEGWWFFSSGRFG